MEAIAERSPVAESCFFPRGLYFFLMLIHQLDVWDGDASNDVMICDSELQSQKTKEGLTAFKEDIQHAFSSFQWFCLL